MSTRREREAEVISTIRYYTSEMSRIRNILREGSTERESIEARINNIRKERARLRAELDSLKQLLDEGSLDVRLQELEDNKKRALATLRGIRNEPVQHEKNKAVNEAKRLLARLQKNTPPEVLQQLVQDAIAAKLARDSKRDGTTDDNKEGT